MAFLLASSRQKDPSQDNLLLVMIWAGIMFAAAAMALVPLIIARVRDHRHVETILAGIIVWGLLAALSVGHSVSAQIAWTKEYKLRIETGYYDPQAQGDAPLLPWQTWGVLALGYALLVAWASIGQTMRHQPASTPGEP
jgi:hypothetical protein